MEARTEILQRLRSRSRFEKPTPRWRSQREFDDLASRFTEVLTAAEGEVYRARTFEGVLVLLDRILEEVGARNLVVNSCLGLDREDLSSRWSHRKIHFVGESSGDLRAFCSSADVGLSGVDGALAETGTIIVSSGPGRSRLATLLPPLHIALVPLSVLVTDIFTWVTARDKTLPSNIMLISGPSKTADIEQTLAIGVHGPKRLVVLLYED